MFLFLYSSLLLYLTLHPECFEVEQICFSCLMVYFNETGVLAFVRVLFANFVWSFLRLMFSSDVLFIYLSHTYHALACCFLLSVFQYRFLAFLFLLFWYMLGLLGEYDVQTHWVLPSSSLQLGRFCCSIFFPKCSRVFENSLITIYNSLWVFVSFVSNVGALAFSDIGLDKSRLSSTFSTLKNSIVSCIAI